MITDTISQLIRFNTSRGEKNEVRATFDFIESFLGSEHFDFHYIERHDFISMIICFKGRDWKKEKILLNGHIDVVPGHDHQFEPYVEGNKLYGRGAVDMKGSIAAIIHAYKSLVQQQLFPSVACIITSDEELGGKNGAGYICETYDFSPEFVLVPDGPRNERIEITNREKGIAWVRLEATGKSCHASRPWLGENANEYIINAIQKIKNVFSVSNEKGWYTTVSVTYMHTDNTTYNKIPAYAEAVVDIRFVESDAHDPHELLEKIIHVVPEKVNVSVLVSGAPVFIPKDNPYIVSLTSVMEEVSQDTIPVTYSDAGHDARYFAGKGIPTALIGPIGGNWHGEDEWVDILSVEVIRDSLVDFFKKYG